MPNPECYPPQDRVRLVELISSMGRPTEPGGFLRDCKQLVHHFHPAFFAELDWQEMRPDREWSEVYQFIDDFTFFFSLGANLRQRYKYSQLTRCDLDGFGEAYQVLFDRFSAGWPRNNADKIMDDMEILLRRHMQMSDDVSLTDSIALYDTQLSQIRDSIYKIEDSKRLLDLIGVYCINALYLALDAPTSRRSAKRYLRQQMKDFRRNPLFSSNKNGEVASDQQALLINLAREADAAEAVGLISWAEFARAVHAEVAGVDFDEKTAYDGQWTRGTGYCARCSMWFAFQALRSIDSTCSFVNWAETGLIYLPVEISVFACPFCGCEALLDMPVMFYAPHRKQVVYCIPTRGMLSREQAFDQWEGSINNIRSDYKEHLASAETTAIDDSIELITYNMMDFLYAAHMGETVNEDHVYNFIEFADGTGLLVDYMKGFARGICRTEVMIRKRAATRIESDDISSGTVTITQIVPDSETENNTAEQLLLRGIDGLRRILSELPPDQVKGWRPADSLSMTDGDLWN